MQLSDSKVKNDDGLAHDSEFAGVRVEGMACVGAQAHRCGRGLRQGLRQGLRLYWWGDLHLCLGLSWAGWGGTLDRRKARQGRTSTTAGGLGKGQVSTRPGRGGGDRRWRSWVQGGLGRGKLRAQRGSKCIHGKVSALLLLLLKKTHTHTHTQTEGGQAHTISRQTKLADQTDKSPHHTPAAGFGLSNTLEWEQIKFNQWINVYYDWLNSKY